MDNLSEIIVDMLAKLANGRVRVDEEIRIKSRTEWETSRTSNTTVKITAYTMGEGLIRIDFKVRD